MSTCGPRSRPKASIKERSEGDQEQNVSNREDHRLVEHLYDELSPNEEQTFQRLLADDPSMADELHAFESTLGALREDLPAEDPAPHLDAKILAYARQAAAESEGASWLGRFRKFLRGPAIGLVAAGTAAIVGAFLVLPQMKEPTHDAPSVALEAAGPRANQAPVAAEPVAEAKPPPMPSELAMEDEPAAQGVASAKAEATNARLDDQTVEKRKVATKLAKEMDGWERQAADQKRAPAGGLPGGPLAGSDGARGGGGAEGKSDRVVARFEAPVEEAKKTAEAPRRREAPASLEFGEAKGRAEADGDDAFGDAVAAMPKDASPDPESGSAPPAAAPPAPVAATLGASRDEESAGAGARAPAKVSQSVAARPASPAPSADKSQAAPSPARTTLTQARGALAAGDLPAATKLAERGVVLAKNTPELGWALLEAAEILYACGQYGPAERYAAQARANVEVAARARAERLMKQARSKATESDSAPAATTR